jgi:hypothetical protein
MSAPMRRPHDIGLLAIALTAVVSACGQSSSQGPVPGVAHGAAAKGASQSGDAGIDPDLVSAVNLNGASSNLFSVKFKVDTRPLVTNPLQVKVLMIPAPGAVITHLQVLFQASDGLKLQSDRSVDFSDLSAGAPVEQQVTVVPQKAGVLSLSATVLVDTGSESVSRTYAIPLIAADSRS